MIVQRQRGGSNATSIRSARCSARSGSRRTRSPSRTTGSTHVCVATRPSYRACPADGHRSRADRLPGMTDFPARVSAFLAELFELEPTFATAIGDHTHDARWPDHSTEGRAVRASFTDRWLAELTAMTELTGDDAIDRDLLIGELEAARFEDMVLREETWNPVHWIYLIGDGLFTLNAREFAPLADRLRSTAGRLETLPPVFDAARVALVGHDDV